MEKCMLDRFLLSGLNTCITITHYCSLEAKVPSAAHISLCFHTPFIIITDSATVFGCRPRVVQPLNIISFFLSFLYGKSHHLFFLFISCLPLSQLVQPPIIHTLDFTCTHFFNKIISCLFAM